jgi:transposase-like protein
MRSDKEKISIINHQQSSGLTVSGYCEKIGIHLTQFYTWKNKYLPQNKIAGPKDFIKISNTTETFKLEIILPNGILVRSSIPVEPAFIKPLMGL